MALFFTAILQPVLLTIICSFVHSDDVAAVSLLDWALSDQRYRPVFLAMLR
jgi:hypothetical protein